jgi:hypothetical protein
MAIFKFSIGQYSRVAKDIWSSLDMARSHLPLTTPSTQVMIASSLLALCSPLVLRASHSQRKPKQHLFNATHASMCERERNRKRGTLANVLGQLLCTFCVCDVPWRGSVRVQLRGSDHLIRSVLR